MSFIIVNFVYYLLQETISPTLLLDHSSLTGDNYLLDVVSNTSDVVECHVSNTTENYLIKWSLTDGSIVSKRLYPGKVEQHGSWVTSLTPYNSLLIHNDSAEKLFTFPSGSETTQMVGLADEHALLLTYIQQDATYNLIRIDYHGSMETILTNPNLKAIFPDGNRYLWLNTEGYLEIIDIASMTTVLWTSPIPMEEGRVVAITNQTFLYDTTAINSQYQLINITTNIVTPLTTSQVVNYLLVGDVLIALDTTGYVSLIDATNGQIWLNTTFIFDNLPFGASLLS